jgi:tRNA uridine 5-carboxymethylaminomethyl modification enzyme
MSEDPSIFKYPRHYDVIIVGAGHAGCEAAAAAARMGCSTMMLTMNLDTIGQMSCNPAIGGLAKGHIVREIDALGGVMGINTDATGIQFRMLNTKKGASVRAPRAQCDKKAYQFRMKKMLEEYPNLDIKQGSILKLRVQDGKATGVYTTMGVLYESHVVVVTTGTFLGGLMHVGFQKQKGGRMGDSASNFSDDLRSLGFVVERLKTGTPPRLHGKTIDFSKLEVQPGDFPPPLFSYMYDTIKKGPHDPFTLNYMKDDGSFHVEHMPCYITFTSEKTHEIIKANLDKSPMYCGIIEGIGPRYCPSIEDKVVRFASKERHQLFLEPEGLQTDEYYINGCSTSLPFEVQYDFIRSIPGLENVEILRPGYAVEYDYCPPTQLNKNLETKAISHLFFAGQINGTSGYEEAAGQGIMAGINAALKVQSKDPFILGRHEAYIGVLVDDLVTKGTKEPYRMFTSRAEYRLLLRQDNADLRLTERAGEIGLVEPARLSRVQEKKSNIEQLRQVLAAEKKEGKPLDYWLKRPEFFWEHLPEAFQKVAEDVAIQIETDIKYAGYITREKDLIERSIGMEDKAIPEWVDYDQIQGIKTEAKLKLKQIRPATFGQAGRISGINPSDISILAIWVKKGKPSPATE